MPRQARVVLPHLPHHVVHRGHNRNLVFASDLDYSFYLFVLGELKFKLGCKLYAYCLMSNHVHLLLDPCGSKEALSRLMKGVAGRFAQRKNALDERSGAYWESRYRSSVIATEAYRLACCRYIELNPVRAGIAQGPESYAWSSFGEKTGRTPPYLIDEDYTYAGLGLTRRERQIEYERWVKAAIPDGELQTIQASLKKCKTI